MYIYIYDNIKKIIIPFIIFMLLLSCYNSDETTFNERTSSEFLDSLNGDISSLQWWRTAVSLKIDVTTDAPVKIMLISSEITNWTLFDYKEANSSGTITMTIPQGQGNTFYLKSIYNNKTTTDVINLTGKLEEYISLQFPANTRYSSYSRAPSTSLFGNSIIGGTKYYQFTDTQLLDFYKIMEISKNNVDAKTVPELICNYELESNGPFYITWANGYMGKTESCILGYYYHSPDTYDDIVYVDISETHIWDYIDGLAKVQYQISFEDTVDGYTFKPNTWYDANFDLTDKYGATQCMVPERLGDNAYNSQEVYLRYKNNLSALRGISFLIDIPKGKRLGFYLRSNEEPYPDQWSLLRSKGIKPYVSNADDFMGTCFSAEFMNIEGNGKGLHRSFVKAYDEVIWMGMEDVVKGGDHDCNDVMFGVVVDLKIHMPTIVDPELIPSVENSKSFPWTIAYEDVNRHADFDFNDAVIKLTPNYSKEQCCVTVMAAGSEARMYLHYDGPDGDVNMGEIHELLGGNQTYINTRESIAITPFSQIGCVPWPKGYTMANDAKRFYIEIQRGTCDNCTDVITLAQEPGRTPEALLVAGEWQWPKEGININTVYTNFPKWAENVTSTRYWDWYNFPETDSYVSY